MSRSSADMIRVLARGWDPRRVLGKALGRVSLYLVIVAFAVLFIMPLLWLVTSSLKPESEVYEVPPTFLPRSWQFSNLASSTTRFPFWISIRNTLFIVGE